MIHTVKGFNVVNEAEVDVSLKLPYFLHDSMNVGNLTSGSSAVHELRTSKLGFEKTEDPEIKLPTYVGS